MKDRARILALYSGSLLLFASLLSPAGGTAHTAYYTLDVENGECTAAANWVYSVGQGRREGRPRDEFLASIEAWREEHASPNWAELTRDIVLLVYASPGPDPAVSARSFYRQCIGSGGKLITPYQDA